MNKAEVIAEYKEEEQRKWVEVLNILVTGGVILFIAAWALTVSYLGIVTISETNIPRFGFWLISGSFITLLVCGYSYFKVFEQKEK